MSTDSRVWLITGANSGLGLALAQHALSRGDKVIAAVRDLSKIPSSIEDAAPILIDLNSSDAVLHQAGQDAWSIYGHIDVLVNNAGYGANLVLEEITGAEIRTQFQTNVFGPMSLIQSLIPSFRAQKSGQILNISSVGAFDSRAGFGAYCASKAALESLSEALADEVKNIPRSISEYYRDPNQGYRVADTLIEAHVNNRKAGDVKKCASRMWEVVHKAGLASGVEFDGSRSSLRVQLGPDCARILKNKIGCLKENVDKMERIWSSTEMDKSQIDEWVASKSVLEL